MQPTALPPKVTTESEPQQVQPPHIDNMHTSNIPKGLDELRTFVKPFPPKSTLKLPKLVIDLRHERSLPPRIFVGQEVSTSGESSLHHQGVDSSTPSALAQNQSPPIPLLSPVAAHSTPVPLSFTDVGLLEVDDFFKDCPPTSQTIPLGT